MCVIYTYTPVHTHTHTRAWNLQILGLQLVTHQMVERKLIIIIVKPEQFYYYHLLHLTAIQVILTQVLNDFDNFQSKSNNNKKRHSIGCFQINKILFGNLN